MNVTEHFEELSVQEPLLLKEPVEFAVKDTVPVGDEPDTVASTVVGELTVTDDGESVRVVVVVALFTVRVDCPELAVLIRSPLKFPVMTTEPAVDGVNVTEHVPSTSTQEFVLKEPEPAGTLNDTASSGNKIPVTVTETVVGTPTLTDDGESVTVVITLALLTVRVD